MKQHQLFKSNMDCHNSLTLPHPYQRLLLHTCCAPCAGDIMESLVKSGVSFTLYFYNPNIHPRKEYLLRKEENMRFADKLGIPFIDADYDVDNWFARAKGMEQEPERGIRCTMCFEMRFQRTALYAFENGFDIISSTLGISRWKDMQQINAAGEKAALAYQLHYWTYNWRKEGGSQRMLLVSKRENFYQQEYCGCAYSLRDTNHWRQAQGRPRIRLGEKFYGLEVQHGTQSSVGASQ